MTAKDLSRGTSSAPFFLSTCFNNKYHTDHQGYVAIASAEAVARGERLARREGRTKSELLREALRRYLADSRWRELQEFSRPQARKLGIEESDVERLVAEYRAER